MVDKLEKHLLRSCHTDLQKRFNSKPMAMIQLPSSTSSTTWRVLLTSLHMSSKRVEAYCKKASTTTITIPTIVRTWFLTSTCSPTIRPTSVVCSLGFQMSSSTSRAIHVRQPLSKTSPTSRHWGTIT